MKCLKYFFYFAFHLTLSFNCYKLEITVQVIRTCVLSCTFSMWRICIMLMLNQIVKLKKCGSENLYGQYMIVADPSSLCSFNSVQVRLSSDLPKLFTNFADFSWQFLWHHALKTLVYLSSCS